MKTWYQIKFDCFVSQDIAYDLTEDKDQSWYAVNEDIPLSTVLVQLEKLKVYIRDWSEEYCHGARNWYVNCQMDQDQYNKFTHFKHPYILVLTQEQLAEWEQS